jgi:hypothetical protein
MAATAWIGSSFRNPNSPALIQAKGDGLLDVRLTGEQVGFESGGNVISRAACSAGRPANFTTSAGGGASRAVPHRAGSGDSASPHETRSDRNLSGPNARFADRPAE